MVKNLSHTLAYSLIGLQELNLAYRYPTILWNCACLISDSGGNESEDIEEKEEKVEEEIFYDEIEDFSNEEEAEDEVEDKEIKKKKKTKTTNYGKIATAIGKMKSEGIDIVATDINKSKYTFSPDVDNNRIIYGLSGITRIGEELIEQIIANREYVSVEDFISKVKINKPQMINLIKSGAFDNLYDGNRIKAMNTYIDLIYDKKKRVTLQNMKMLIDFNLIPSQYDFECKVYNFNKYLRKFKDSDNFFLNQISFKFYEKNFDIDLLKPINDNEFLFSISKNKWDKIYQKYMDNIRPFIKEHNKELLDAINNKLRNELWNKYCLGSISQWEMDSVSCYIHEHELARLQNHIYGFTEYDKLSSKPDIEYTFETKDGKTVPIYRIHRIAGTVLDRDKAKKNVTLLTTKGVVTVKIYGDAFGYYDKRISQKQPDGTKKVIENSIFSRGNKIIVTGIRKEENFICKKYKSTPYPLVEQIIDIDDKGYIKTYHREL